MMGGENDISAVAAYDKLFPSILLLVVRENVIREGGGELNKPSEKLRMMNLSFYYHSSP